MFFLDCSNFAHVRNVEITFFLLNLKLFWSFRSKIKILTKGQNNRSLHRQILLGAPEKGKNPKSTELCYASYLAFI